MVCIRRLKNEFYKKQNMSSRDYHYTECGLNNIYLLNGYKLIQTSRGKAVSINDIDGLRRAIGLLLVTSKKELSGEQLRFLRKELLKSPTALAQLLGVSLTTIQRWEKRGTMSKSAESLLRLLYREHVQQTGCRPCLYRTRHLGCSDQSHGCIS